ncbi:hypothetical protein LXL04_001671 [Taraxacum kok-saghyz]
MGSRAQKEPFEMNLYRSFQLLLCSVLGHFPAPMAIQPLLFSLYYNRQRLAGGELMIWKLHYIGYGQVWKACFLISKSIALCMIWGLEEFWRAKAKYINMQTQMIPLASFVIHMW